MHMNGTRLLEAVAPLFDYPSADYRVLSEACNASVQSAAAGDPSAFGEAARFLSDFTGHIAGLNIDEIEELYTRTFDLNPTCSLDIGWHLYGEQYDRGTFLVTMRTALRENGIEESTELPDHLPSVLRLLSRLPGDEAADLSHAAVFPAVEKMLTVFADDGNPYRALLLAVQMIIHAQDPKTTQGAHHG